MSKRHPSFCGSADHPSFSRRSLLAGAAAGAATFAADMTRLECFSQPAFADELKKKNKSVILLWLAGGASQLETWDPKPGRETGGAVRFHWHFRVRRADQRIDAEDGHAAAS